MVETHIHAFPRKSETTTTIYPDGVPIWDDTNKRIIVGDGTTPGGQPQASLIDLTRATSVCLEQVIAGLNVTGEAVLNGKVYVHHLVSPKGTIYTVNSGDCYWTQDNYTHVKMASYIQADESTVAEDSTWIAVYNPRPAATI